jgi:hypothetical protein
MRTRSLAILIFDEVEVLDFCGPFEVFSFSNRFTDPPAFSIVTVGSQLASTLACISWAGSLARKSLRRRLNKWSILVRDICKSATAPTR